MAEQDVGQKRLPAVVYWPVFLISMVAILAFWAFVVSFVFAPALCPSGLSNFQIQHMDQPGPPEYCLVTRISDRFQYTDTLVQPALCASTREAVGTHIPALREQVAATASACRNKVMFIVPRSLKTMGESFSQLF